MKSELKLLFLVRLRPALAALVLLGAPALGRDAGAGTLSAVAVAGDSALKFPAPKPAVSRKDSRSSARLRGRWETNLSVRGYYDDNILDYSQRDLDHFKSRMHLNKFALETTDDWITDVGGDFGRRWGTKSRHEYRLRLSANAHWYARNAIKNWFDYAAEGRWSHRRNVLIAHLGWTPHFYLRDLQVRDVPRQHPDSPPYAAANYHTLSANVEYRFWLMLPLEQRLSAGWKRTDYSHTFDERDNTAWWGNYGWIVDLGSAWSTSCNYRYSSVRARGATLPVTFADISHHDNTVEAGLTFSPSGSVWEVDLSVLRAWQTYTSNRPADYSHIGRHDREWRITPEVHLNLAGGWQYRLFYQWTHDTSNKGQTSDLGAFDDRQFGLRLAHTW